MHEQIRFLTQKLEVGGQNGADSEEPFEFTKDAKEILSLIAEWYTEKYIRVAFDHACAEGRGVTKRDFARVAAMAGTEMTDLIPNAQAKQAKEWLKENPASGPAEDEGMTAEEMSLSGMGYYGS